MPYKTISLELLPPVAYLTIQRPEKRNALSLELMEEMIDAFNKIALKQIHKNQTTGQGEHISVVILRSSGSVFCSGHDIAEMKDQSIDYFRQLFDACSTLMQIIQKIPQPVIAEVQGPATAAGCQLVASCDLAIASENAWFATPGVKIDFFCTTPGVAVGRSINRKKALEMLFTGEPISPEEAVKMGLINKVVSHDQLESEVKQLAEKISRYNSEVIGSGKKAFYHQISMSQQQAYDYASEEMAENAASKTAQEGFKAFLEKKKK